MTVVICSASTFQRPKAPASTDCHRHRWGLPAARAQGLADPTRLTLAAALLEADELCVCDLANGCNQVRMDDICC